METYTRVPQWLATDAGVRALEAPARVALYDIAVNGGHASCGADPVAALDALCVGAGASLPRMVDLGVVQVSGGRIYLMAPDGLPSAVGATTAPRDGVLPPRIGEASPDGLCEPLRAAQRHLGALWTKASAKTLDARLAWLDTPAGERAIKRERITREQAVEIASRAGANGGRFGTRAAVSTAVSTLARVDTVAVSTTVSTSLPSHALPSKKEQENTREERTRAASTRGVYFEAVDTVTASTPAASTREQLGLDAVAALDAVRQRAQGKLNASHDARVVADWQRLVRELAARAADPVTTVGAYEVLGDWIAAGGFAWMTQGRPTLALLLRPGKLAELLDEARTWDAAGRAPLARRAPTAPAAAPGRGPARRLVGAAPVSSAEDFARDAAGPDPLQELLRKANLQ